MRPIYIYLHNCMFMDLQTRKYTQILFDCGSLELHTTKSRHFDFLASCAILGKNHHLLRVGNFLIFVQLASEPQNRDFVVWVSKDNQSNNICSYFYVSKPISVSEVLSHIKHIIYLSNKNYDINYFVRISAYKQNTQDVLHKKFSIAPTLFYVTKPENG